MSFGLIERGVLLLLLGLLLVLSHRASPGEPTDKPRRKFSLAFLLSVATGLACIALLYSTTSMDPRKEWFIAALVVIPLCVVLSSVFAVSYWEPVLIPPVLFLVSRIFHFMPTDEKKFPPLEYLAVTMVLSLLIAAVGSLVLYLTRKIRTGQWSWSLVRGMGWGLPCAVGTMIALKSKMAMDIAFRDDYTIVWIILGEMVLITGLAGLTRKKQAVQVDSPRPDPADWRSIRDYSQLFRGGGNSPVDCLEWKALHESVAFGAGGVFVPRAACRFICREELCSRLSRAAVWHCAPWFLS